MVGGYRVGCLASGSTSWPVIAQERQQPTAYINSSFLPPRVPHRWRPALLGAGSYHTHTHNLCEDI